MISYMMNNNFGWNFGNSYMPFPTFPLMFVWLFPFAILDVVLKGFALWRAARRGENIWFIALLVVNSLGILPGIYLLTHPNIKTSHKKRN